MMTRTGTRNSNKALPADIQAAFMPTTYYGGMGMGAARLHGNAHVVQQTRRWPWGMSGLGDDSTDTVDVIDTGGVDSSGDGGGVDLSNLPTIQVDPSIWTELPATADLTNGQSVFANMSAAQQAQFEAATPAVQQSMLASLGVPAAQIATVLTAAGAAAANAIRASNGQLPINPQTGLPYNYGQVGVVPSSVFLIGAVAVAALFLFGGRR